MSTEAKLESANLKALQTDRVYQCNSSAKALYDELDLVKNIAKAAAGKPTQWCLISLAASIACVICIGSVQAALIVALPATGFSIWKWIYWAQHQLAKERYLLAEQLIELFSRDMLSDAPISLRLAFTKLNSKENKLTIARQDRDRFMLGWLSMSGQFCDGSKFSLKVAEQTDIKHRKSKVKPKGYLVSLTLAFSKKKYGLLDLPQSVSRLVQMQKTVSLKSCRSKGNVLNLSAKMPPLYPGKPEDIARELTLLSKYLLMSSYGILEATKKPRDSSAS